MDAHPQAQPPAIAPQGAIEPAAATPPASSLDTLLAKLSEQIATLTETIAQRQATVKSESTQQRQLRSDEAQLKRAAEAVSDASAGAREVLDEATGVRASVQDRIDALPADEKSEIDTALGEIDTTLAGKETALGEAEGDLNALREQLAGLERDVDEKKDAAEQAFGHLSALAQERRAVASPLRRLAAETRAAAEAGQDRKVYILSVDLDRAISALGDLLKDEALDARVSAWEEAQQALAGAREALEDKAGEVAAQEGIVADLRRDRDAARAARKEQVKSLFVAPREAPVSAPA